MVKRRLLAKGFTLVEVMVVIVIIMILASMVLVGFARAQKRAQATQCINNLRQVGVLIINYANQKGGGYLPDFSILGSRETRDLWILELDFVRPEDRYISRQGTDKILPPRMAPKVLRCPADVQLYVNNQSVLLSYWIHPEHSYKVLAAITNQDQTMLGFEGDPLYETANCGCRFHSTQPPKEVDVLHFGGGHVLYADGSVRLVTDPHERLRETMERKNGWDPRAIKAKFGW